MLTTIEQCYKNKNGIIYENIRNIHFDEYEDLTKGLGTYICETNRDLGNFGDTDSYLNDGVYLYIPNYDKTKALRVYKDIFGVCQNYKYTNHNDDYIVSELQKRQKNVKLTEFPTGIVTLDKYVIGQEIPFYKDHTALSQKSDKLDIIKYYIDILNILKELLNNEIIYSDIHANNFLVDNVNNIVRLIDFDSKYLSFDGNKTKYHDMLNNLKTMINRINKKYCLPFEIKKEESLEEIRETILSKKL